MAILEITRRTKINSDELERIHTLIRQLSSGAELPSLRSFNELIKREEIVFLTAQEDEIIAGMLTLVFFAIPTGTRARIEDVVVSDEFRRKGIARQLSEKAISIYAASNARSLDLTSRPTRQAANDLYISLGFETRDTNVYRYRELS